MKQPSLKSNFLVGLTGGIGSGKSTVALIFKGLEIPVFDADKEAKTLYTKDSVREKVIQKFGAKIYSGNFINREEIARVVFGNKDKLNELEEILYPELKKKFVDWVNENSSFPYLIKEAALLIEKGTYKELNKIIHVSAPEEIRLSRVMKRSNMTSIEVKKRINDQLKEEDKLAFVDYNILNFGEYSMVEQTLKIHSEILNSVKFLSQK